MITYQYGYIFHEMILNEHLVGTTVSPDFKGVVAFKKNDQCLSFGCVSQFIGDAFAAISMDMVGFLNKVNEESPKIAKLHISYMMWKLAEKLNILHDNGVVFNDLHGGNVLIQYKNDGLPEPFLIDFGNSGFGVCQHQGQPITNDEDLAENMDESPHIAPEWFYNCSADKSADVYSFGCGMANIEEYVPGLRSHLQDYINTCTNMNPQERPTSFQLAKTMFKLYMRQTY